MKKISQGKFEICTTKADTIDKFMQMQGICREEISGENPIEFYCSKKGKITITNPPTRHIEHRNSTNLFAEVIQQDDKTYVAYYTRFSKIKNVIKLIFIGLDIIIAIFAIIFAIISADKKLFLIVLGLVFFAFQLLTATKEKKNSANDSETLIKELKKRVEAVNLWNK